MATTRTLLPALSAPSARPVSLGAIVQPSSIHADLGAKLQAISQTNAARGQYTFTPPKPKAPSLLGQIAHAITALPQGVAGLVKSAATDAVFAPRIAADVIGGHGLRSISDYFPAVSGFAKGMLSTGEDIIHPARFADAVRQGTIVSKVLGDVGNASIAFGGLGRVLGAGGAAAGEAAGEAAAAGEGAVGGEAANALKEAAGAGGEMPGGLQPAKFRGLASVASNAGNPELAAALQHAGNIVKSVGSLGEVAGNAPALPYRWAAQGAGKLADLAGLERPAALLNAVGEKIAPTLTGNINFRRSAEGQATRSISDIATGAGNRVGHEALQAAVMGRHFNLTPAEQEATINSIVSPHLADLGNIANDTELGQIIDSPGAWRGSDASVRPTVEGVRTLKQFNEGTLPADRMNAMNQVRDELVAQAGRRTGRAPNLSIAQLGKSLLPERVQQYMDKNTGMTQADAESALGQRFQDRLHQDVNVPAANRLMSIVRGAKGMDPATRADLVDQMSSTMQNEVDAGRGLNAVHRVRDVLTNNNHLLPDEVQQQVDAAMSKYGSKRAQTLGAVSNDQTMAVPARFRPAMQDAQRQIAGLLQHGEALNATRAGTGDQYIRMAEETMSTLDQFIQAGHDPAKLIGGGTRPAGGGFRTLLGQPRQRSEFEATTGLHQQSLDAYGRLERTAAQNWVTGLRNRAIQEHLGTAVGDLPGLQDFQEQWANAHNGEALPSDLLHEAVGQLGHAAINPNATLNLDSRVVPQGVVDYLGRNDPAVGRQYNELPGIGPGLKTLGRTNRAFKTWVLPFSPRWHVGNVLGNVIQSGFHAGVGPLELAMRARELAKSSGGWRELFRNEGLVPGLPPELAQGGFNQAEFDVLRNAVDESSRTGRVGEAVNKFAGGSYKLNNTIDNITRSSTYLSRLHAGETTDQALQTTLRSMGDYMSMSPFERNVLKQVFPFYAWLRHSVGATLRLPIQSPARAAMLLHLSDMYADPNEKPGLMAMMGSRIPLGGGLLNVGGISPFPEVGGPNTMLNPLNWGGNLAPALKTAATVGLGVDPGNRFQAITRPSATSGKTMFGTNRPTSPIERLFTDPVAGLKEIGWQATQQGPTQIRSLRDLILGTAPRYAGTGYINPKGTPNPSKRSISQILRVMNFPTLDKMPTGGAP